MVFTSQPRERVKVGGEETERERETVELYITKTGGEIVAKEEEEEKNNKR